MILAFLSVTAVSAVGVPEATYGHIAVREGEPVVQQYDMASTEAIVRDYFADIPVMIEIARCESTFRHTLEDGSILQGKVDPADTGVMQINKRYHEKTATAMNLNLDTIEDNMAYARHLYETQGVRPWNASAPCWNRSLALNY